MLTLTQVSAYIVPSIVLLCFIIGYFIKNLIPNEKVNKFIPMIVTICGILASIFMAMTTGAPITIELIVGGAVSGLASTGVNEFYHQLVDGGVARNDDDTVKDAVKQVNAVKKAEEKAKAQAQLDSASTQIDNTSVQTDEAKPATIDASVKADETTSSARSVQRAPRRSAKK